MLLWFATELRGRERRGLMSATRGAWDKLSEELSVVGLSGCDDDKMTGGMGVRR